MAFSRSPLDSLLAGFLLLFLILDDFHSALHSRIFSLSRIIGCASTPTPLGAPAVVVWLGLTTSWRRTTERNPGLGETCETYRPSNLRVHSLTKVSPDVIHGSTTLLLSLRRLRCVPVPMHSPSVVSRTPMIIVL